MSRNPSGWGKRQETQRVAAGFDSPQCDNTSAASLLPVLSDLLNLAGLTLMHTYGSYYAPNTEATPAVTVAGDGMLSVE